MYPPRAIYMVDLKHFTPTTSPWQSLPVINTPGHVAPVQWPCEQLISPERLYCNSVSIDRDLHRRCYVCVCNSHTRGIESLSAQICLTKINRWRSTRGSCAFYCAPTCII